MPSDNLSHTAMLGTVSIGTWVKRILGLVLSLAICAGLWWLRPTPADPAALAVLEAAPAPAELPAQPEPAPAEGEPPPAEPPPAEPPPAEEPAAEEPAAPTVAISENRTRLELTPIAAPPTRGLVFFQGGLIDPRAYVKILEPIAAAGYLVAILKAPYDLPIVDIGGVTSVVNAYPDVEWWAVGGHSLGGVAAATFAAGSPRTTPGLVLWASYPFTSLAGIDEVSVLSVSGTQDGRTTPSDIEASMANLPAGTTYVAVEGAVHAYFGDYGEQRGDGTPTISREEAQQQIVTATLQWLNTASGVA
jgi:hypothetical protein